MNFRQHPTEIIRLDQQRLDLWLWASRFFKTRKLATAAVSGGHIQVNGQRSKPGKLLKIGDSLMIKKNQQIYNIAVCALSKNRLPAPLAKDLYDETEQSIQQRESQNLLRKSSRLGIEYSRGKPQKRDRRKLLQAKQQLHMPGDSKVN